MKNPVIETLIRDLWKEAGSGEYADLDVYMVSHLLLAHYLNGTKRDFAKWCCEMNPIMNMNSSVQKKLPEPQKPEISN